MLKKPFIFVSFASVIALQGCALNKFGAANNSDLGTSTNPASLETLEPFVADAAIRPNLSDQPITPEDNNLQIAKADAGELPSQKTLSDARPALGEAVETVSPSEVSESVESEEGKPLFTRYDNVWDRLRDGLSLDHKVNEKRVQAELKWYLKHKRYLSRTFNRSAPYIHFIVEEAEARNLPMELALLPVVESAFDPFAYSHGRAAGIWQFIPSTGKHFGLKQNWWYDGRRDVVASTKAALKYLEQLNNFFDGDWSLALASYNAGAGTVRKAVRKNRKKGKDTDYFSLKLPKETSMYVPRLLAISQIIKDPEKFGVDLNPIPNDPYFKVVELDAQVDLAQAAKLAGTDVDTIYKLNPGYNQWATDPDGPYNLALPVDLVDAFTTAYAELPANQRVNWSRYTVKKGDSLISIAKKFNTRPAILQDVNKIRGNLIRVNQKLLIPSSYEGDQFYSLSADNRLQAKQARKSGGSKTVYKVRSGDTLWDIARAHKVGTRQLAKWNGMAPGDLLNPGKDLVIWSKNTATSTPTNSRQVIRRVGYQVRSGDSLSRIANKFSVSVNDLVRWNGINSKKIIKPGQKLKIMVDVTSIN